MGRTPTFTQLLGYCYSNMLFLVPKFILVPKFFLGTKIENRLRHQDNWHQVEAVVLLSSSYSELCLIELVSF